jgi:hypothetical protein
MAIILHGITPHVTGWSGANDVVIPYSHTAGRDLFLVTAARTTNWADGNLSSAYDGAGLTRLVQANCRGAPGHVIAVARLADPGSRTADLVVSPNGLNARSMANWVCRISGHDVANPLGAAAKGPDDAWDDAFVADITTTAGGSLILVVFAHNAGSTADIAMNVPLTRHSYLENSGDSNGVAAAFGSVLEATAGAQSYTGLADGAHYLGWLAAEIRAGSGPPPAPALAGQAYLL